MLWAKYPLEMLTKMPGRQTRVFQEHAAVLDALERNDPEGAVDAMQAHIKTGWDEFCANYRASERALKSHVTAGGPASMRAVVLRSEVIRESAARDLFSAVHRRPRWGHSKRRIARGAAVSIVFA